MERRFFIVVSLAFLLEFVEDLARDHRSYVTASETINHVGLSELYRFVCHECRFVDLVLRPAYDIAHHAQARLHRLSEATDHRWLRCEMSPLIISTILKICILFLASLSGTISVVWHSKTRVPRRDQITTGTQRCGSIRHHPQPSGGLSRKRCGRRDCYCNGQERSRRTTGLWRIFRKG